MEKSNEIIRIIPKSKTLSLTTFEIGDKVRIIKIKKENDENLEVKA